MNDQSTIGAAVARTVRSLRAGHGWSLDQLAVRAGVSKGVLVALEQGRGNPNLGTLIRISQALGVPLTRLVQVEEEPAVRVFPPERQVVLWRGPDGGSGVLLAGSEARPSVELWRWELRPGEPRHSDPHAPGTREILYVEEGTLTVTVDGQSHPVEAGSAALFAGDRPHSYSNEGTTVCRFVLTVLDL
ncbi:MULTISPECIES: helix-turn-helix domain-containing protein [Thermomonospora]|uniref:Transcriptional regulator, XRE family n=1 Tax=Thermomonospora curvata (strain ATCC 19995 / DSM 43183 / JCM 3096 / KCTC 9072 / NBRC 15933 / NCIMB 10081 / Henssen B9) TaxID=471852 RepID=D1A8D2_THECD|nr:MULTISPECIES: XRE family transcriptional regulator [Thermomonospora]ACZ00447.1 transcriptional regulator, XRE family [Thermomonospora curvata DSM 43183]PKK11828.1 MAG: XRE family transcriptional regulator [Thermomonospora sp. CIF 1]